jgi:pimeloyl-ACP methyl ester carboxylesterase
MFGDDDLATMSTSPRLYGGIPDAELAIGTGTSHFLLQEKPGVCNHQIFDLLLNEPVPTVAPIRRAPAAG